MIVLDYQEQEEGLEQVDKAEVTYRYLDKKWIMKVVLVCLMLFMERVIVEQ